MSNIWNDLVELTSKYKKVHNDRMGAGESTRQTRSAINNKYAELEEELNREYEERLAALHREKGAALKALDSTDYFSALKEEESAKMALQSVASKIMVTYNMSNDKLCELLKAKTKKSWKVLTISGSKVRDFESQKMVNRVGAVAIREDDEQFRNRVYWSGASANGYNTETVSTDTCYVLIEGGDDDVASFIEKIKNLNWVAIYLDYLTGATDYERNVNYLELSLNNIPEFRNLVLETIAEYFGVGGKDDTKIAS